MNLVAAMEAAWMNESGTVEGERNEPPCFGWYCYNSNNNFEKFIIC